jgi:hypothetical protein
MELEKYWQALQERICAKCVDGDGNGNCRLPAGDDCALKSFLPQLVTTVANVKSDSIDTYINSLRRNVCILCSHQEADMQCRKREDLECALDRYYPFIVEIIETVRARMRDTEAA